MTLSFTDVNSMAKGQRAQAQSKKKDNDLKIIQLILLPTLKLKEKEAHTQIDKRSRMTRTVNRMNSSFRNGWSFSHPNENSSKIFFLPFFSILNYKTE